MKGFFKNNKYFGLYLLGSLIYISSQFRAGNSLGAITILLFVVILFVFLWKNHRK